MDVGAEAQATPEAESNQTNAQQAPSEIKKDEPNPLFEFIEWAIKQFNVVQFREKFRVTAKGLFVVLGQEDVLPGLYKQWQAASGRPVEQDDSRCKKKLLGSDSPERFYLHEDKNTLWGYIISCPIQNPQGYRVAYYLGTPGSTGNALHPSDPALSALKKVELVQKGTNFEIVIKHGEQNLIFDTEQLKRFQSLARNSKKVQELFPTFNDNPTEGIKALEGVLQKARPLRKEDEIVTPRMCQKFGWRGLILSSWGFVFYFDLQGKVKLLFHTYGRSLGSILREEYLALSRDREWKRPIEIFFAKGRAACLGEISLEGKRIELSWDSLAAFVRELSESPHLAGKETDPKTIDSFISKYAHALARATFMERSKISSYIPPRFGKNCRCYVNEVWIFVISKSFVVLDCIARTGKNRKFN